MLITKAHVDAARKAGACWGTFELDAVVGDSVEEFVRLCPSDASWVARNIPTLSDKERDELERLGCGRTHWKEGKLHCEDGPALTWPDGFELWYYNGVLQRSTPTSR